MVQPERRLEAAERVVKGDRVRWLIGMKPELTSTANLLKKGMTDARFDLIIQEIAHVEFERELIMMELEEGSRSVEEVALATGLATPVVFRHIVMLMKARRVEEAGERDGMALFKPCAVLSPGPAGKAPSGPAAAGASAGAESGPAGKEG
jgi:hypothetical protein